ncbi:MAG: ParB/RepB/Spo0J family partition protein [Chthonomonadales bacterium]
MQIHSIPVEQIVEDPDQPRQFHDPESLMGLAESIRRHGILQPITVTPLPNVNMYRIVTGERRWRAAQIAGLTEIPCLVKELEAEDAVTEQLIENLQREDLQPLEKARALRHIKDALGATNRELGARIGLSERTVGYLLDLLDLPEPIAREVVSSPNRPADGQITEKHARFLKLLNEQPDLQNAVVEKIKEERITGERTGKLVSAIKRRPERAAQILEAAGEDLERLLAEETAPAHAGVDAGEMPSVPGAAERIHEFHAFLMGLAIMGRSRAEIARIQDALTVLGQTVDGLLRECRLELDGK